MLCERCSGLIPDGESDCPVCGASPATASVPERDHAVAFKPKEEENNHRSRCWCSCACHSRSIADPFAFPKSLKGEYLLAQIVSDIGEDQTAACVFDNEGLPVKLSISDDGSGLISLVDGTEYASLTYDKGQLTGQLKLSGSGSKRPVSISNTDYGLYVYDEEQGLTLRYIMAGSVDLSAEDGDYVLTHISSKAHDDHIEHWVNSNYKIPTKLSLNADGTGSIVYTDGSDYASLTVNSADMTGEITYTKSSNTKSIYVTVSGDSVRIYDTGYDETYEFTRADVLDITPAAGDYILAQFSSKEHDDHIEYWTNNSYKIPTKLTLNADGTGSIVYTDGSDYASLTVNSADMTGEITYKNNSKTNSIYVTVSGDFVRIYDKGYHETYEYVRAGSVDLSAVAGDYKLEHASVKEHDDYADYLSKNNYKVFATLKLNKDGTGRIAYSDGSTYADFTVDSESMIGTLTYAKDKSKGAMYLTFVDGTLTLYDETLSLTMIFALST